MEQKRLIIVSFAILLLCVIHLGCSQKLVVENVNNSDEKYVEIDSSKYDYGVKNMDIIWNISYPVEINITRFDLNSQAGDFLIIGEYPLSSELVVSGAAAEDVIHLLPIENSLILSQEIIPLSQGEGGSDDDKKVFRIHIGNPCGGFIYFHSAITGPSLINSRDLLNVTNNSMNKTIEDEEEPEYSTQIEQLDVSDETISAAQPYAFQGFKLTIECLELNPTTTERTTTEKLTGVDMYLRKHIRGKSPGEFYAFLGNFTEIVANMGNAYVNHTGINLTREIYSSDIRLDEDSIFFCEQRLAYYNECVEIQLAIPVRNVSGDYVMNTARLEEMWSIYATSYLNRENLTTYEPPDGPKPITPTWLWLAAILAVILIFSSLLCFTFLGNFFQNRKIERNATEAISTMIQNDSGQPSSIGSSFVDNNPIINKLMQKIKKGQEDSEHFVMLDREIAMRGGEAFSNKSNNAAHERTNKISNNYQRQELRHNPMSFLNDGFVHDEYYEGVPSKRHNHHQHHTFQAQVHSSQNDEGSDEDVTEFMTSKSPNNVHIW